MPIWLKPPKSFVRRRRSWVPKGPAAAAGQSLTPFKSHSHVQKKNKFFAEIMRLKRRRRFSLSGHTPSSVYNKSHGASTIHHKHDFFQFVMNLKRKRRFFLSAQPVGTAQSILTQADMTGTATATVAIVANGSQTQAAMTGTATATLGASLPPYHSHSRAVAKPQSTHKNFFQFVMGLKSRRRFSLSHGAPGTAQSNLTFDPMTGTATATVAIAANGSQTQSAMTSTATATVAIAASSSVTQAAMTGSATATVAIAATESVTQAAMTGTATATAAIAASGSQTQAAMTSTATATVAIVANESLTQADMTGTATAITGSGTIAQSVVTQQDMTGVATFVSDSSPDFIASGWTPNPGPDQLTSWTTPATNPLATYTSLAANPLAVWTPDPDA